MDFNDDENIEWLMESSKTVEDVVENDVDFQLREQESLELCNFLQVLRSSFETEPALVDCKAKGTVASEEEVQKLFKRLKALGYFFSVRHSEKKTDKQNCKLMIVNKKNPPSSHPYRVVAHTHYYCSYKNKSSESETSDAARTFSSCKAVMDIRQIEVFTSISLPSAKRKRIEVLKKFRNSLIRNPEQVCETKYILVVPLPKMHNHPRDLKGKQLNDEVKAAMHCILRSGVKSVPEIQQKLYQIVDKDFENDAVKPSRENSAFYPNQKIIYNHLRHDGLNTKKVYKKNQNKTTDIKSGINKELNWLHEQIEKCDEFSVLIKTLQMLQEIRKIFPGDQQQ